MYSSCFEKRLFNFLIFLSLLEHYHQSDVYRDFQNIHKYQLMTQVLHD